MNRRILGVLVAGLVLAAGVAAAQETVVEIKNGEVIAVNGNSLVYRGPEGVKSVEVPDDFRFEMSGKKLTVHQLEPGMRLTAIVKTTQKVVTMTATEVRSGQIVHTQGGAVVVRRDDGELKKFTTKSLKESGAVVTKDGKPIDLMTLRVGDRISATFVSEQPPTTITEQELRVFAANAPAPPQAQPRPKPAVVAQVREPRPAALPKTASPLPLVGGLGLLLVATGLGLTALRRSTTR
jgi:hypothetical protein